MQFALAFVILVATWLMLRRQARGGSSILVLLDVAPILLGWFALAGLTSRPVTSAVVIFAGSAGLAVTDAVKRATLREPLVFADRAELLEVVRHPELYLPFAGPVRIVGGALVAVAAAVALLWFEPPIVHLLPIGPALLAIVCIALPIAPPLLPQVANFYRRHGVSGDPAVDMRRHGFLACLIMHATIARAERRDRRAAIPAFQRQVRPAGPVVLVQAESFFDARRLGPTVPPDLLPHFDRLRAEARQAGRLTVDCWGANTVRSEFAGLTGVGADALGLDRFNPYERFAQVRIRSLAWQMKQAGYRTICLHPFDKRFYARNRVMPLLGFDEFRGLEVFEGAERDGRYVADEAIAREIARIVRDEGPRVFILAMTIANHGPWNAPAPDGVEMSPGDLALRRYLSGLQATDRMIGVLMAALPQDGLLGLYGDHQPSLPETFAALGFTDERTDYAFWSTGGRTGPTQDLAIKDLANALLALQAAP